MTNVHFLQTHTDPDIAEAMEKIAACNAQMAQSNAAGEPWKAGAAGIILAWWEKELARLTNSSSCASSRRTH